MNELFEMNKLKIFCFPYAGGSAAIYNAWNKQLKYEGLEFIPVELAGRGRRMQETLYANVADMVSDVLSKIEGELKGSYAFFGHSMGGMICYELYNLIREKGLPLPKHIFFSGRGAPSIERKEKKQYHLMSEEVFKKEVIDLGGTPPEFFNNPELLEIFLPLLKNDFKLAENAPLHTNPNPLACDISVFIGTDEDLTREQCDDWERHTHGKCTIHYMEGGHFFIHQKSESIIEHIQGALTQLV